MDLKRYIFHGLSEDRQELIRKNRRLIILRWIYFGILGAIAVGIPYLVQAPTTTVIQHAFIFGTGLVLNTVLYFANNIQTKSIKYYHVISFLQILIDLGAATAGVAIQGGVQARAIILYVLPILAAGLLLMSKTLVYAAAGLSAIAYNITIIAVLLPGKAETILPQIGGPFLFYPVLFFIIARLVVYVNEHNMQQTQDETQDELLALLTHQLRHPGSVIGAIVDTMETNPELKHSPELARYVGMIKTENARSIHLVNNVLQAADPLNSNKKEELELVSLVKQIARNSAMAGERTDDLKFQTPEESRLLANTNHLHMILENVLDNAIRFSQPNTPIEVKVENAGTEVKIVVIDHGEGMGEQQQETVFDKFGSTTTPEGQPHGAGLGMYLVKKLVKNEGGRVDIESSLRKGTRVTIILNKEQT